MSLLKDLQAALTAQKNADDLVSEIRQQAQHRRRLINWQAVIRK